MKRYKDFLKIKYPGQFMFPGQRLRKSQQRHSAWVPPRILRNPPMRHRDRGRYADSAPTPFVGTGWRCDTPHCQNRGYGPMLRDILWQRKFHGVSFMCEPCMVRRLGRPLGPYDLRNCLMNLAHPAFDLDLKVSL